jgi:hypothetical protein
MTDNTDEKQGGRFKKGQSGNPAGRPKGSLNQTTLACQELLNGEAENITRKAIEKALSGDITALRLCFDRIVPPRKDNPLSVNLPAMAKQRDMKQFTAALLDAVKSGEITINEAQGIMEIAHTVEHYLPSDWDLGIS